VQNNRKPHKEAKELLSLWRVRSVNSGLLIYVYIYIDMKSSSKDWERTIFLPDETADFYAITMRTGHF
jgi:hypothetical protein